MQEKTLEEEFDEKFNLCCRADDCDADCSKQRLNVIVPFIKYREDKAREEGRKEGFNQRIEYDKEGWDEELEEAVTQYKEELLRKVKGLFKPEAYEDAEKEFMLIGWNDCVSEVKKLITS